MRKISREFVRDIAVIFFLSLTPLLWFRPGMLFVGHDLVAPLNPQVFLAGRLFTWINQFFGQSQALILGTIPIHFLDAIPSFLGFGVETGQKIVYVVWFFFIGTSAYVLGHVLRPKSSIFKLTAAILYQFNFFILQAWWIAEKSKFSAYIAAPLLLAVFLLVEAGSISVITGAILGGFILFFFNAGGVFGLPLFGGGFVILGSFILFSLIEHWYERNMEGVKRIILLTTTLLVFGLALNAYFVLPAVIKIRSPQAPDVAQIGGVSGVLSWASEISANTSFLNLMRLQGIPDWYDNPQHPYAKAFLTSPMLIAVSFIWPLLSFAALFVVNDRKSQRITLYLFLVYLLGMFFAAGTHPPLGFLYGMLMEKIPGFFVFRTPYYKFVSAVFFAGAFLAAFVIDSMPKQVRRGAFVFFAAVVLGYHFPYFKGDFFQWRAGYSTRLAVPQYVFDFGSWLNNKEKNVRVLMLPPDSPDLGYGLYRWGYLSFQAIPTLLSNNSVVVNNDKLNEDERSLVMALYNAILLGNKEGVAKLTSTLGITNILLTRDAAGDVKTSIPLDVSAYEKGLNATGLFTLEKRFGQWDVYARKEGRSDEFFLVTPNPAIVDGSLNDAALFIPKLSSRDFIGSGQGGISDLGTGERIIVPTCLTCPKKNRPTVVFPDRNILPGDPFYSLVLLAERLKRPPDDPKGAIYNALGISLKRVSEINQMIFEKKLLTQEVIDRYTSILEHIRDDFQKLPTAKDKYEVASDVRDYMRAQRSLLMINTGTIVTNGSQTILSSALFSAISAVDKLLEPYVSLIDNPAKRLYQFEVANPASFEFSLYTEDEKQLLLNPAFLRINLDGSVDLKPNERGSSRDNLISFGEAKLDPGKHELTLSLPPSLEATYPLLPIETEFSQKEGNSCFGMRSTGLAGKKLYNVRLGYRNDFSQNLLFFIWEGAGQKERLLAAGRLPSGLIEDEKQQLVQMSPDAGRLTVAICAPNLTSERIKKQFTLTMSEVVEPRIVVSSTKNQPETPRAASYISESPTRYRLSLPAETSSPTLLVFSERFDPWWELKGTDAKHIRVNGYANGWILPKSPNRSLVLEYKGERYFFWGIGISAFTFFVGGAVLLGKSRLRRRPYDK